MDNKVANEFRVQKKNERVTCNLQYKFDIASKLVSQIIKLTI